jgi:hypothetical protein
MQKTKETEAVSKSKKLPPPAHTYISDTPAGNTFQYEKTPP